MEDARHDISVAKEMIDEALGNFAQRHGELAAMQEEARVATMARQMLDWGDESGLAVIAAVAILRLGGFK